MADVQPLHAIRYDTSVVGPLSGVTAPPYDVISPQGRATLLERSKYNVVAVDLPAMDSQGRLQANEDAQADPYEAAGALFAKWRTQGALIADSQPTLWAHTQEYTGPDGIARTRRGFFCRVRIEDYDGGRVRPHERTHPGPKEDRLRLMRATQANLSAIFSLYSDPSHAAWDALAPAGEQAPDGEVTDDEGTVHRIWRVSEMETIASVQETLRDAELLIADGHHRYETAQTYAQEIGGEGPHRYVLMCLVALEDPGLTVFPTHRLVSGLDEHRRAALAEAISRNFESQEVSLDELAPPPGEGPLQLGYIDSNLRHTRLTLRSQAIADEALPGRSSAYRSLDTGVLEALLLKGALGMSDHDIAELNGLWYARDAQEAIERVRDGGADAAFVMRPTPVARVRDVAASGENMPPKSTFFFPKLLTGLLFNPLA
ncbi:MAG TPA: DUF1015 domain-containing protein [Solirubrobacteraceae bacterium]|jgi:uncharacterized protein (DUF1015 family)|nr:DUF1015 domain-containing protein [Solirubrobacteraceae bacterium]